ncbi:hypothetical protein [Erythrobacter alti]|uniref:tetratricopeptide repeat protein n=1 Tax=Erythrobacter alti TaxID=1896145 RepID=UPI0030F47607
MVRAFFAFASLFIFTFITTNDAQARDWYRAESNHFILYSEDSEQDTLEFVQDLERLDEVLRIMTGVGLGEDYFPRSAKVTVFRFGETRDMSALAAGNLNTGIGGFFIPRATGSVAFVPRQLNRRRTRSTSGGLPRELQLDPKAVLFHEYVHYFMYQYRDAPYPLWYTEGFAELFSNVEFNDDNFVIGKVPTVRSPFLATQSIDLEEMFDRPGRLAGRATERDYAHGWLLASHLNLNAERRGQMGTYLNALLGGNPPMVAAEIAFGDLEVLHEELEEFRQGAARPLRVPHAVNADPQVDIRRLTEDEAARMELMITSKRGVDEEGAEKLVADARRLVAEYPDSAAVLLAATEAEFDARNYDEAEALAQRVLAIDAQSTEATIYLADVALRRSYEDPSQFAEARRLFAAANRMEIDHPYPLYGFYMSHLLDPEADMTDNASAALEEAFALGRFDSGIRQAIVHWLLTVDRVADARIVGAEYVMGNGRQACVNRAKFTLLEEGEPDRLLESALPDHPGKVLTDEEREADREEFEAEVEEFGCELDD